MLATMNTVSQTAKVIAKADAPFLPEGMNIKATFTSADASATTTVLPRNAVQSDEYMSEHWIMKLAEDSTAVKVPVKTGYSNADSIEIIYPPLSARDPIISIGGYGLENGAKVKAGR